MIRLIFFAVLVCALCRPMASADVRLCGIEFSRIEAAKPVVLDGKTISGERMVRRITTQICPRLKGTLWDRYYHITFSDDEGSFFAYSIGHDYLIPFSSDSMSSNNPDQAKRFEIAKTETPVIYLDKIDADSLEQSETRILKLIAASRNGVLDQDEYFNSLYKEFRWIGLANTWSTYADYSGSFVLNVIMGSENYKAVEASGMKSYYSSVAPYDFDAAYLRVNGDPDNE